MIELEIEAVPDAARALLYEIRAKRAGTDARGEVILRATDRQDASLAGCILNRVLWGGVRKVILEDEADRLRGVLAQSHDMVRHLSAALAQAIEREEEARDGERESD